ncbi:MAG TPA: hypothetical protein VG916_03585 [Gemmatimonadaceae bacterium]|nr:hypothetical protein [Gemmatimonadaceae bacterium]
MGLPRECDGQTCGVGGAAKPTGCMTCKGRGVARPTGCMSCGARTLRAVEAVPMFPSETRFAFLGSVARMPLAAEPSASMVRRSAAKATAALSANPAADKVAARPVGDPPAASGSGSAAGASTATWLQAGTSVLTSAAQTVVALVAGAREADRQARADAMAQEATRLANARDVATIAATGVEAATNAAQNARTSEILLPDRAAATSRLSDAQGRYAAAAAAKARLDALSQSSVALNAALDAAGRAIDHAATAIESSNVPVPPPTPTNPAVIEPPPPERAQWSTAKKVGVGAGVLALLAGAYKLLS